MSSASKIWFLLTPSSSFIMASMFRLQDASFNARTDLLKRGESVGDWKRGAGGSHSRKKKSCFRGRPQRGGKKLSKCGNLEVSIFNRKSPKLIKCWRGRVRLIKVSNFHFNAL